MGEAVFELNNVEFSYLGKFPALSGINININKNEKIAIIGANGSGKSTLLHMLDGLIFPDNGTVKAFGTILSENAFDNDNFSRDFRKRVGLVFQNPDIQLFCPTVREDILFGPLQLGVEKDEMNRRTEEIVDLLGIRELLDRPPQHLSIGEKRKVAIASTLAVGPDVLILDEPTAGLDPLTCRHIIDLLIRENLSGKTIITSTHDLHIVKEISDQVYVFSQDKRIVRHGPTREILNDIPLLKTHNLIHIHKHRHHDVEHSHSHRHSGEEDSHSH